MNLNETSNKDASIQQKCTKKFADEIRFGNNNFSSG